MFFIRLAFASTILASLTFCVFWASRLGTKATEHTPTKTPTNVPTNLPTNIPTKTPTNVPTVPIFVCTRTIGSAMFMKDWLYWYASQGVDRITLLVDARNTRRNGWRIIYEYIGSPRFVMTSSHIEDCFKRFMPRARHTVHENVEAILPTKKLLLTKVNISAAIT